MFSAAIILCQTGTFTLGVLAGQRTYRLFPEVTVETVHRQAPLLRTGLVSLVSLVLLGGSLIATLTDDAARQLPLLLQRYANVFAWSMTLLWIAGMAGFSLTIALRTGHHKRRGLLLAVAMLIPALNASAWPRVEPIADHLERKETIDGIVLQSHDASCAAASVANVGRLLGKDVDELAAARLLGTTRFGSSPGQIRYALDALGIGFHDIQGHDLANVAPPAILFTAGRRRDGPGEHAIVYVGRHHSGYEIWDPLRGRVIVSAPETRYLWRGGGLACGPYARGSVTLNAAPSSSSGTNSRSPPKARARPRARANPRPTPDTGPASWRSARR